MEPEHAESRGAESVRALPSVDHLLRQPAVANLLDEYPRQELLTAVRKVLEERRAALLAGRSVATDPPALGLAIREQLHRRSVPHLRRVINATGIVLHTNLGRAPLPECAVEAIADLAGGYCNLEIDLETGRRGSRYEHVREILCELTGAEDALVVNNNAAGTYLALNSVAARREVVVSRGQLVEIGGSYRMPDVMAAAGCRMIEVGTTNRTHLRDYERAITEETAALLRVHTSNYRVMGFVRSVALAELVELARQHGLWLIDDLGSGVLDRSLPWPAAGDAEPDGGALPEAPALAAWDEPAVRESVAAGADLVLFSGDKLLGGPQAGVVVGRAELIARMRANPLARIVRPDKLTLAGLEATLRLYRDPATLAQRHPVFRMLSVPPHELEQAARELRGVIAAVLPDAHITSAPGISEAGGGTLPVVAFPTWTVRVRLAHLASKLVADALRVRDLPIFCRVQDEDLVFDCRTILAGEAEQIASALADVCRELTGG